MINKLTYSFIAGLLVLLMTGCAGDFTFHKEARAGDTVALPIGWKPNFRHNNITVYIKESYETWGDVINPEDPSLVQAVVNLYPDPLSSLVVSGRTQLDMTPSALTYSNQVTNTFGNGEQEWGQTTVFLNLPYTMATGEALIEIDDDTGDFVVLKVNIVPGTGTRHDFSAQNLGSLSAKQLTSLERINHKTISFSGTQIPYAIEINLSHDPDVDADPANGNGRAYLAAKISNKLSLSWTDDGTSLKAIIMPSNGIQPADIRDFKFYVTGGISGLNINSVSAFDQSGAEILDTVAVIE